MAHSTPLLNFHAQQHFNERHHVQSSGLKISERERQYAALRWISWSGKRTRCKRGALIDDQRFVVTTGQIADHERREATLQDQRASGALAAELPPTWSMKQERAHRRRHGQERESDNVHLVFPTVCNVGKGVVTFKSGNCMRICAKPPSFVFFVERKGGSPRWTTASKTAARVSSWRHVLRIKNVTSALSLPCSWNCAV